MSIEDRHRWDAKYAQKPLPPAVTPDDWLVQGTAGLAPGRALELACGLGHNAIWLAQQGWNVDAVDISSAGLTLARQLAEREGQAIRWIAADLDQFAVAPGSYDLVVVFRFLDRIRVPSLIESALRSGGTLIYETFTAAQLARPDNHLRSAAFTLSPGELPRLFGGLRVIDHREVELRDRTVARLLARKP